jgi:hypothetical protein
MKSKQVQETISRFFIAVDSRNWDEVKKLFADTVLLDYTSMAGGEPANLLSEQIIESWKGLLPGFDSTHHQLGNFIIKADLEVAKAFCYVTATHYLKNDSGNNVWTVVGSYDLELVSTCSNWLITKMKFNLKYIDGNSALPAMAQERLKK